jgi:hypothetical protein
MKEKIPNSIDFIIVRDGYDIFAGKFEGEIKDLTE